AESSAFHIEWRDRTVFIYPAQPGRATNLFVWTKRGRVVYELLPAATSIGGMDVTVDTRLPAPPDPPRPSISPRSAAKQIPADFLLRARAVDGRRKPPKHRASVSVRDVYREQDRLYLRYVIRNNSKKNLTLAEAPRVSVTPIANSPSFLHAGQPMQIAPQRAATLPGQGGSALPLLLRESLTTSLAPGASTIGIVGVRLPAQGTAPLVVRLVLPIRNASPLEATVIVP
ncbi:MAG: hypothetical protein ACRD3Y_07580, partial [Bryobacteraceae bacterium]